MKENKEEVVIQTQGPTQPFATIVGQYSNI